MLLFRLRELKKLRTNLLHRAFLILLMSLSPVLATVTTFVTYAYTGHALQAPIVFAALQLFGFVEAPITNLAFNLVEVLNALVASARLRELLLAECLPSVIRYDGAAPYAVLAHGVFSYEGPAPREDTPKTSNSAQQAKRGKWYKRWSRSDGKSEDVSSDPVVPDSIFQLKLAQLRIERGSLVCVVGRFGSGKTTLVQALLGELRMLYGEVVFGCERISYVGQRPWIQSGSVRDHILFGAEEDKEWLSACVSHCALQPDLAQWKDGLNTELGGEVHRFFSSCQGD